MMQKHDSHRTAGRSLSQRTLLLSSLGWLSGVGMLSAAPALAQTAQPVDSDPSIVPSEAIPSAQDLLAPAVQGSAPSSFQVAPPEPILEPSQPVAPVGSAVSPLPAAVGADTLSSEGNPAPDSATGSAANSAAPLPPTSSLVAPDASSKAGAVFDASGSYIDSSKDYSLGATSPEGPSIIFSERSSGCQTILQPGQAVPNSVCPPSSPGVIAGAPGAINMGSAGLSVYGVGSDAAPRLSGQDFYNLTVRPPAILSQNIRLAFPLSIPAVITSMFGWRLHPIMGESRFHSGTDLGAPLGTPVVAAMAGKVASADFLGGYGLAVVLRHNNDTEETLYGHLSELFVKPGETVKQGEVIGRVGSTGLSTGPHLHFEFRKQTADGWVVMDPGQSLEYSMAQLIKSLQTAQDKSKLFQISWVSFTKALKLVESKQLPAPTSAQLQPNFPQATSVGLKPLEGPNRP